MVNAGHYDVMYVRTQLHGLNVDALETCACMHARRTDIDTNSLFSLLGEIIVLRLINYALYLIKPSNSRKNPALPEDDHSPVVRVDLA